MIRWYELHLTPFKLLHRSSSLLTAVCIAQAMPLEQRFWDDLLRNSSEWGLTMYEQDWLYNEFEGVTRATTDVYLARDWLLQMGRGAANNDLTIQ